MRLTADTRRKLLDAIHAAEGQTRAEFVLVIVSRADAYLFPPLALATVGALLLPGLLWIAGLADDFTLLYGIQLLCFALLAVLLRSPAILPFLIPRTVAVARARRLAREIFYRFGLHRTRDRSGVLLFAALTEHHVEIIADEGIDNAVPAGTWDQIVRNFVAAAKAGGPAAGFETALTLLGKTLGEVLPRRPDDSNEIVDRLIEL